MRAAAQVFVGTVLLGLVMVVIVARAQARPDPWHRVTSVQASPWPSSNRWIRLWTHRDHDLAKSIRIAAATFHVSAGWLSSCKDNEGGDTGRETLRWSLRTGPHGRGWNLSGSYAFGPWQFMLDDKPAAPGEYGTFGRYVHQAFATARSRRVIVPFRFKTPDSYVGQALTVAYMFSVGQSSQWNGAGC